VLFFNDLFIELFGLTWVNLSLIDGLKSWFKEFLLNFLFPITMPEYFGEP
jgi:hypothetical protein